MVQYGIGLSYIAYQSWDIYVRPHLCSSKMNAACSHCSGMIEIPKLDQDRRLKLDRTCFPVYGSKIWLYLRTTWFIVCTKLVTPQTRSL